jgi:excisionase family DNA binding protein
VTGLEGIIERIAEQVAERTVKAAEKRLAVLAENLVGSSELVDVAEAARLLHTTSQAIHKRVQRGTLEAVRKGGRIKFRRQDLVGGGDV